MQTTSPLAGIQWVTYFPFSPVIYSHFLQPCGVRPVTLRRHGRKLSIVVTLASSNWRKENWGTLNLELHFCWTSGRDSTNFYLLSFGDLRRPEGYNEEGKDPRALFRSCFGYITFLSFVLVLFLCISCLPFFFPFYFSSSPCFQVHQLVSFPLRFLHFLSFLVLYDLFLLYKPLSCLILTFASLLPFSSVIISFTFSSSALVTLFHPSSVHLFLIFFFT